MDYNDKLGFIAAILLAARVQRGNQPETNEIRTAVRTARTICEEIEKD